MSRLLALLLVAALLAAACAKPSPPPRLTWTGTALEGLPFVSREMENITVHYAALTAPAVAESAGERAQSALGAQVKAGAQPASARAHVWLVPDGYEWPVGLASPPAGVSFRAAGPGAVVGAAASADGLPDAVALSATQRRESPAYAVDWLHVGMGAALAAPWGRIPTGYWTADQKGLPYKAAALYADLTAAPGTERYRKAAAALASLLIDRWGIRWTDHERRAPAELTPAAALSWATGASDQATALARWQERIDYMAAHPAAAPALGLENPDAFPPTANDISPVRVTAALSVLPTGPGPNENYSPHSYTIAARYDPAGGRVTGEERLVWQNGEGMAVETLCFNLWPNAEQYQRFGGGIAVESVTVDGKPAAVTARALDLVVPLGRPVAPGERAEVVIRFTTRLPAKSTMRVLGQEVTARGTRFHLAHWFPMLAVLDDRGWNLQPLPTWPGEPYSENASFKVTLDLPAGMLVGATGHRAARREVGDRWVYEYQAPNVRDFVATGGTGLHELTRTVGQTRVTVIDNDEAWAADVMAETARALPLLAAKFGPFPYPDLVVACCNAIEFPGLFYVNRKDQRDFWKVTTYHELAHQWFYSAVGNDQYAEPWLDEGFARYGERLAVKAFGPVEQLRDIRATPLPDPVNVSSNTAVYVTNEASYSLGVYNKGALVLEDLESLLGTRQFDQVMHLWVERFSHKTATTADFVRLAREVSGRDLADFFRAHKVDPADRSPYRPVLPLGTERPR